MWRRKEKEVCKRGSGVGVSSVIQFVMISVLLLLLETAAADRTFTKVYEPIEGILACFKRLNGTHEIGCRSSGSGGVGVLHLIEDEVSLQWVLRDGPHAPYIAVMYPEHFTRSNIIEFRESGRVKGVLLMKEKESPLTSFSTDSSCPNNPFGIYNRTDPSYCRKWNDPGNSLLFESFDFPIFYLKNDTEAEKILKCYESFNRPLENKTAREWPLCAAQLSSFMLAAVDTPTCIRRSAAFSINPGTSKVCDPLGDQNLWATLFPVNGTTNQTQSALVIGARLDGASLFDEVSPSADSTVTALVTLLTIVKHLGSLKEKLLSSPTSPFSNVYFMLFNGEAFGYIGSSRIVYDMTQGKFPLKLDEIKYFVEINQAALRPPHQSYFIHQSEKSQSKEFTDIIEEEARKLNLNITTVHNSFSNQSWGLPPSSLQPFLRERPNITGVVITNHRTNYLNKYYNSIFDTKENVEYIYGAGGDILSLQYKIASLAATVANSVVRLFEIGDDDKVEPDVGTVDELLYCYLETKNCNIFREISDVFSPGEGPEAEPYPLYVGVAMHINSLTQWTKGILVTYLGTKVDNVTTEESCHKMEGQGPFYFLNKTCWECNEVNMTEARSPAFIIPNYDWSSGRYSTWSESVWQKFSVRIFLKPSLFHEIMTLVSGIVVLIVSMVLVRFVNERKELIFPSRADAIVC